jgi:hypothetical protein
VADNTELNPGTGGDVIASDDIGGVKHQRVKLSLGADGTASDAPVGGGTEAGTLRVTIASDSTGVLSVDDNGGALTVDGTVTANLAAGTNNIGDVDVLSIAAGDNNIGNVDIASIAAGDNNIGNVDVVSLPALAAGTNNIGDVDVLSVVPGTGATNLGKAEDAAHSTGDVGVMALFVRQDAQADFGADGDYVPGSIDADGALRVNVINGAAGGTSAADDADFTDGTTSGTPIMGVYESTPTTVTDGDLGVVGLTETRALKVAIASGGISGIADDAAFTPATSEVLPVGFTFDDVAPDSVNEGDIGAGRMSANRCQYVNIRDNAGNERGLNIDASGQLAITLAAAQTLATVTTVGTVTNITNQGQIADDAAFTASTTRVNMAGYFADETATDSVDEGDGGAARMTLDRKVITTPYPHTAGGLTIFRSIDLDETEEEIKATAGQVYGMWVTNTATATRFVKFYNATAANVTVGTTTPVITIGIPGNASDDVSGNFGPGGMGIAFGTAITVAATTGVADNDTGAPGANEVIVNVFYA